jgi:hypothetical protein
LGRHSRAGEAQRQEAVRCGASKLEPSSEAGRSQIEFWILSNSFKKGIQAGIRQLIQNAKLKTPWSKGWSFRLLSWH